MSELVEIVKSVMEQIAERMQSEQIAAAAWYAHDFHGGPAPTMPRPSARVPTEDDLWSAKLLREVEATEGPGVPILRQSGPPLDKPVWESCPAFIAWTDARVYFPIGHDEGFSYRIHSLPPQPVRRGPRPRRVLTPTTTHPQPRLLPDARPEVRVY